MASMIVIGESYTNNGHCVLIYPRFEMAWKAGLVHSGQPQLQVTYRGLDRLFTGHSDKVGIIVPAIEKRNLSAVLPFFMTNNLDLAGLNFILAHTISFSRLRRIDLLPITDVVVTIRSSMYALIGGWRTPVFIIGPQHSISADFTIIFMAGVKRVADSMQPVMIPLSSLCQSEIDILDEILTWKLS